MRVSRWAGPVLLGVLLMAGRPAGPGPEEVSVYPEKAREDLLLLRQMLEEAHPALHRFATPALMDSLFDQISDSLVRPVTVGRFRQILLPLFHAIGDANCHTLDPEPEADALLLPVRVKLLDGVPVVVDEPKGFRSIPRGSRLLAINGRSMDSILTMLRPQVVTDGANMVLRDALLGERFSTLYHRHVERSQTYRMRFVAPGGQEEERIVPGLTRAGAQLDLRPAGLPVAPWSSIRHDAEDLLWLRLGTFDGASLSAADVKPQQYLKTLRKELHRMNARTLVIDVRNAGGNDLALVGEVFALMAEGPFRVLQGMKVASVDPPRAYELAEPSPQHYAMVPASFVPDGAGAYMLNSQDELLRSMDPVTKAFSGRVYVVCDGLTRDAAAAFVMLAKRSGRARIVGEEIAANGYAFTGGEELLVTLPNSGVRLRIPLVLHIPAGTPTGPRDRGEQPHHTVIPRAQVMARGGDTVKEVLLQLVREMR